MKHSELMEVIRKGLIGIRSQFGAGKTAYVKASEANRLLSLMDQSDFELLVRKLKYLELKEELEPENELPK